MIPEWPDNRRQALSCALCSQYVHALCCIGVEPFDFPVHTFYGESDQRITKDMVLQWKRFTRGRYSCTSVDGHHLWPADKTAKSYWLAAIVMELEQLTAI